MIPYTWCLRTTLYCSLDCTRTIETIRTRTRTTTSTRFQFTLYRVFSKYRHPGKVHLNIFFTRKVSTVTFSEGSYTLSRPQNDKTSNIHEHLITCFRHYDILAKTRSRMTTATSFPAKMTRVHGRALFITEKISYWLSYSS